MSLTIFVPLSCLLTSSEAQFREVINGQENQAQITEDSKESNRFEIIDLGLSGSTIKASVGVWTRPLQCKAAG